MKKLIFSFLTLCCLNIAYSQTNTNPLLNDTQLSEAVNKFNDLVQMVNIANNDDSVAISNLEAQINNISTDLTQADYNIELVRIMKLPQGYDVLSILQNFRSDILLLKDKYQGDFTNANIENSLAETNRIAPYQGTGGRHLYIDCTHPYSNLLCIGAVGAAASIAASACSAGTLLLGIPACLAGTLIIAAAGMNECHRTWCN